MLFQLKLRSQVDASRPLPIKKRRPDLKITLMKILANEPLGARFQALFANWDALVNYISAYRTLRKPLQRTIIVLGEPLPNPYRERRECEQNPWQTLEVYYNWAFFLNNELRTQNLWRMRTECVENPWQTLGTKYNRTWRTLGKTLKECVFNPLLYWHTAWKQEFWALVLFEKKVWTHQTGTYGSTSFQAIFLVHLRSKYILEDVFVLHGRHPVHRARISRIFCLFFWRRSFFITFLPEKRHFQFHKV